MKPKAIPEKAIFCFHDFAGHEQYFALHELVLMESDALFLIVVDASQPPSVQRERTKFWLQLVATRLSQARIGTESTPSASDVAIASTACIDAAGEHEHDKTVDLSPSTTASSVSDETDAGDAHQLGMSRVVLLATHADAPNATDVHIKGAALEAKCTGCLKGLAVLDDEVILVDCRQ